MQSKVFLLIEKFSFWIFLAALAAMPFKGMADDAPTTPDSLREWIKNEAAQYDAPAVEPDLVMDSFAQGVASLQLASFLVNRRFDLDKSKLDFFAEKSAIYTPHIVPFLAAPAKSGKWLNQLKAYIKEYWGKGHHNKLGIGWAKGKKISVVAVIVAFRPVALAPLPRQMLPAPSKIALAGRVDEAYENPRLFIKGPSGNQTPEKLKTNTKGEFRHTILLDAPGVHTVEVMVDSRKGPEIGAMAHLYCMVEPPANPVEKLRPKIERAEIATISDVINAINVFRQTEGLPPLKADGKLQKVAQNQSDIMLETGEVSHRAARKSLQSRLENASIPFSSAGENVAFNGTPAAAFEAMLESPAHRKALLTKRFKFVGIGIAGDEKKGCFLTTIFTSPKIKCLKPQQDINRVINSLATLRKRNGLSVLGEDPVLTQKAKAIMNIINDGKTPQKPLPADKANDIFGLDNRIEGMEIITARPGEPIEFTSDAAIKSEVRNFGLTVRPLKDKTGNLTVLIYATN